MGEVVITHAVRTPIGRIGGGLRDVSEKELGRLVVKEILGRSALAAGEIDQVILGHVRQSADPSNTARVVALMAGIPESVPAYTVHRQCGSGLQAIMDADRMIRCGEAEVIVAGGTENMSQATYFIRNARHGLGNGDHPIEDSLTQGGPGSVPEEIYGQLPMGITAENLAEKYRIPREEQDRFSLDSQVKAARAIQEGRFKEQIVPVPVSSSAGRMTLFDTDEHPRMTTLEKLAALPPAFRKGGSVTAGNSSGRNDGAAAVLVMAGEKATGSRQETTGADPVGRRERLRPDHHGHRSGGMHADRLEEGEAHLVGDRCDRAERGLRVSVAGGHPGMDSMGDRRGDPHGEDQSQRRRHCPGASPRMHGRGPDGEMPLRAAACARTPLWPHHDVLRRRSRRGHDHRKVLMCEEGGTIQ